MSTFKSSFIRTYVFTQANLHSWWPFDLGIAKKLTIQLRRQQVGSSYMYQIVLQRILEFWSFRANSREMSLWSYRESTPWPSYTSPARSGARTHWQSCQNLETSYRDVATLLFLQAPLMIDCIVTSQSTIEFMHKFIKAVNIVKSLRNHVRKDTSCVQVHNFFAETLGRLLAFDGPNWTTYRYS